MLHDEDEEKYWAHTRWGRVGEFGQVKTVGPDSLDDALKEFDKKFKDKSGHKWEDRSEPAKKGKYTFLEKNYEDDEDEAEDQVKEEEAESPKVDSKLPIQTQRLMELIFNQNHFNAVLEQIGYNANKLPLGKLSKATLKQGFEHLNELASLIKHPSLSQNKYQTSQEEVGRFSSRDLPILPCLCLEPLGIVQSLCECQDLRIKWFKCHPLSAQKGLYSGFIKTIPNLS